MRLRHLAYRLIRCHALRPDDFAAEGQTRADIRTRIRSIEIRIRIRHTATIDKDSICFADFPIKDIVLSIVKDETMADQIVEAVGQVSYKVGYKGTLNAAKDSVHFSTATKPLKLAVQIPSATNSEETQALVVEVSVDPVPGGAYSVEDSEVEFSLNVTEVKLGEGENQEPLPNFNGMTLNFDMTQDKVTAHQ